MADSTGGNGWTKAEQMVFYRLDHVDRRLIDLQADIQRLERELSEKMAHNRDELSGRFDSVMGDLAKKVAELERAHVEQKVKVAAIAGIISLVGGGAVTWLLNQILN